VAHQPRTESLPPSTITRVLTYILDRRNGMCSVAILMKNKKLVGGCVYFCVCICFFVCLGGLGELVLEVLDFLPLRHNVDATHVTVGGQLLELRLLQFEVADDAAGAEIKIALNDLAELIIRHDATAVGIDEHGEGLDYSDGIGDLHEGALGETIGNQGLGSPAGRVGGRSIDLGVVLSGEGTTTVSAPAAVGVDDDLAAGQAGVAVGAADDESAGGVDVVDGVVVEVLGGDHGLDDMLHEVGADLLVGHVGGVLSGDQDGMNALRGHGAISLLLVLGGDLDLAIGADPLESAVLANVGEALAQAGGQLVGEGHHGLGLVSGVAKHVTLVTGTEFLDPGCSHAVDALADVRALFLELVENLHGLAVQADILVDVANVLAGLTDNSFDVDLGFCGKLTENHDHAGLGCGLAGNLGVRVLLKAGIEHGIRNLIAKFVGVALVHTFGGEEEISGLGGANISHGVKEVEECKGV